MLVVGDNYGKFLAARYGSFLERVRLLQDLPSVHELFPNFLLGTTDVPIRLLNQKRNLYILDGFDPQQEFQRRRRGRIPPNQAFGVGPYSYRLVDNDRQLRQRRTIQQRTQLDSRVVWLQLEGDFGNILTLIRTDLA